MRATTKFLTLILSVMVIGNIASAQYYSQYYPQTCNKRYHNYNYNNYNYNYNYINVVPTTYSASNIYQNNAKINGYVNYSSTGYSNQNIGYAWFEYGTSQYNLNLSTNKANIYYSTTIDANLKNLACGQTYYYRAVATGSNGTQYGSTLSFTTSSCYNYYQNYNPYNYYYDYNNYNNYDYYNGWYGY